MDDVSGIRRNCIVLLGHELVPTLCSAFEWAAAPDGRITRIEAVRETYNLTADHQMMDGTPLTVIAPAFYNSHTHVLDSGMADGAVGMSLEAAVFRPNGWKYRELRRQSADALVDHVRDSHQAMASCGTVVHCDFTELGSVGAHVVREAQRRNQHQQSQPCVEAIVCSQFDQAPFTADELLANAADLPHSATQQLRMLLDPSNPDCADGVSESTMNDLTDHAWNTVNQITRAFTPERIRAIHCLESDEYRTASYRMAARDDLERAIDLFDPHLVVHMTAARDNEIALLAATGKPAVVCARANASLGLPLPPIAKMLRAGIPLLLGTDNVMLNSPNILAEMDFVYKITKSQMRAAEMVPSFLDPCTILKMITINAARVFHSFLLPRRPNPQSDPPSHVVGLAEGAFADFVVFDFSAPHLRHSRNVVASIVTRAIPNDVVATYWSGKPIYQRHQCTNAQGDT